MAETSATGINDDARDDATRQMATVSSTDAGATSSGQTLTGTDGNDTLRGGAGDDTISGGDGLDTIHGEGGNDRLMGDGYGDTIHGGDGDDTIDGNSGRDTLYGEAGADTLDGGASDDALDGGAGADQLTGGRNADRFIFRAGEADGDTITDFAAGDGDRIEFYGFTSDAVFENVSGDLWRITHNGGTESETIRITGTVAAGSYAFLDSVDPGDPDPEPDPEPVPGQRLAGTSGDDTLVGGDGDDRLISWGGKDALFGGAGDDELDAGGNDDMLDGGAGADTLIGGNRADLFIFNAGEANGDTITDFSAADGDRIEFRCYNADYSFESIGNDQWRIAHAGGTETLTIHGDFSSNDASFVELAGGPGLDPEPEPFFYPFLYFAGESPLSGNALWGYDGDHFEVLKSEQPENLTPVGEDLFYTTRNSSGQVELWRYNGQSYDGVSDDDRIGIGARELVVEGDDLYFRTEDADRNDRYWKADGATEAVTEIPIAESFGEDAPLRPFIVAAEGEDLILVGANPEDYTYSFWRYDAETGSSARLGSAVYESLFVQAEVGDDLLFDFSTIPTSTVGLAALDLDTGAITTLNFSQRFQTATVSSVDVDLVDGTDAYFTVWEDGQTSGGDFVYHASIWRYDSTTNGTTLVADIAPEDPQTISQNPVLLGGDLFFEGYDGTNGEELWRVDGETGALERLTDIGTGAERHVIGSLTTVGDDLFFAADDGTNGSELWRYDGGTGAIDRVSDIAPGSADANPGDITVVGNDLYFAATNGAGERELWLYDGDTGDLVNLNPDDRIFNPSQIVAADTSPIA